MRSRSTRQRRAQRLLALVHWIVRLREVSTSRRTWYELLAMSASSSRGRESGPSPVQVSAGSDRAVNEILRRRLLEAPRDDYRANDPVRCAHGYDDPRDREVVALLSALLAFGKVAAFLPKVEALLERLGPHPRRAVEEFQPHRNLEFYERFRVRLWTGEDIRYLLLNLQGMFERFDTLEDAFLSGARGGRTHRERLAAFARRFYLASPAAITGSGRIPSYYHMLVVDPSKGSASKRWNLFLRWVVRPADGVDLGLWTRVSPRDLVAPLDVHVGRISGLIGLRRRRTLDWRAAEEVTAALQALDPDDPLRFDLPLSHIGISEGCRARYVPRICGACSIRKLCRVYRASRSAR